MRSRTRSQSTETASTQTTREVNKELRRQCIIAAAERLIRTSGSTEFSMNDLAAEAGTSMKTTYNLIGSKAKVLHSLLSRSLALIDTRVDPKGPASITAIFRLADVPIGVFTSEPRLYRPLLRYLLGGDSREERPLFMARAFNFWRTGLLPFEQKRMLKDLHPRSLALHLHTYFAGALDLWAQTEIDTDCFRRHVAWSVAIALLPIATAHEEPELRKHIRRFGETARKYEIAMTAINPDGAATLSQFDAGSEPP